MHKLNTAKTNHKYLHVAESIESMIHDEVLKIGDKLPSVRMLSNERGISMGTAFQAYYELEGKGLIESRPKSGYYVRFNNKRFPSVPSVSSDESEINEVGLNDMIAHVYKSISSKDLINFSVAVPDIDLLPAAKLNKSLVYAMRASKDNCLNYEDTQGNKELRKQVSKFSFNWGGNINPENILITAGCMEALAMCLRAVTNPGDVVAVESPTYFGIFQLLINLGLKAVEIPADPIEGIDVQQVEKAIINFSVKACVFVPNFNNPLGSCMPDEKKKLLVKLITKYKVPLIEDDLYGELYFGRNRPKTCKSFDTNGWVLYCSSVSKSLAPGYRVGWCIPGRFLKKVIEQKMAFTITGSAITQAAIAHFLEIGRYEYHLKNLRSALHTQCLRYMQVIIDNFPPDIKISRPQGGFILWIELSKNISTFKLYHQAMKYSISIAPGSLFSSNGSYQNCIRISFGKKYNDSVEYGLIMLGKLIKKMIR